MNEERAKPDSLLTLREVAADLRVSVEFVRQRCVNGTIRSVSLTDGPNKSRRVRQEWLDDYKRSLLPGAATAVPNVPRQSGPWRWSGSRRRKSESGARKMPIVGA